MTTTFVNNNWILNKQVTVKAVLESSRWNLESVLYEELIFRGAILYIAINKIGISIYCNSTVNREI